MRPGTTDSNRRTLREPCRHASSSNSTPPNLRHPTVSTHPRALRRLNLLDGAGGVVVIGHLLEHLLDPLRAGAVHAESADHRAHVAIQ
jgi:hypothetical protein